MKTIAVRKRDTPESIIEKQKEEVKKMDYATKARLIKFLKEKIDIAKLSD